MKKFQIKRLEKLATFLDTLPKQKFNFGVVTDVSDDWTMQEALKTKDNSCGTVGCAIGWSPAVFPKVVQWKGKQAIVRMRNPIDAMYPPLTAATVAVELFGMTVDEAYEVFYPNNRLGDNATPKQVAKQIRKFIRNQ